MECRRVTKWGTGEKCETSSAKIRAKPKLSVGNIGLDLKSFPLFAQAARGYILISISFNHLFKS
jgi:hypothetical protein